VPIADTGRYDQLGEKLSPVCLAEEAGMLDIEHELKAIKLYGMV